jgi:hypothetical protein
LKVLDKRRRGLFHEVKALNEEIKTAFWNKGGRRPMQGGIHRSKSLSEIRRAPYLESRFGHIQVLEEWKI